MTARSRAIMVFGFVLLPCAAGHAQVTQRVSISSTGVQATNDSIVGAVSGDGRYVVFHSFADNLVTGDTNSSRDVFVRDRVAGTTGRESLGSGGVQGNSGSGEPAISDDGRYVAFQSLATNLVAGDTNVLPDIFVRDRLSGTTERVSVDSMGAEGDGWCEFPSISSDGRYVAFMSYATNLVAGDTNGVEDIFVHDRVSGATERVSVDSAGVQGDGSSYAGGVTSVSMDGRYVTFSSASANLVAGDTNGLLDVFVRDRLAGTTERLSVSSGGAQGNNHCTSPTISGDGRFVSFTGVATNLVAGDTNGLADIFVRDRLSGTTERVSLGSGGLEGNSNSGFPSISGDGRYVAFLSDATNLVAGDTNLAADIFLRDRLMSTTQRMSVSSSGAQSNGDSGWAPSISSDGRFITFDSLATNLVAGDTSFFRDVFVRDRAAAGFISLCDPGVGGVIACPCGNPPGSLGRGCNNSSATGGAILSASGVAYLSMDSLVFTSSGEKPTALSIVTQWMGGGSTGAVFGQGVRCTSGTFKRLYSKSASGGSITAPNFGAGDLPVSVRSAAAGDTILAGQSRWYLVYYRDPTVLGGCPSTSTFNATQTGRVTWSP